MTNNERIADFIGWKPKGHTFPEWERPDGKRTAKGDFFKEDEHAIQLMPILVDKGYGCHLNGSLAGDYVTFDFFIRYAPKKCIESVCQPTIANAIASAVIDLINTLAE